jgi:putative lipoic acid-binding regulatory protein
MSGKILVMTRQNANQATADLTMRATSDGQYVNFNVHVILNAVIDEPPYVVTPVPDVVMDEFPKLVYIDFNGVATDPDDPDELIEYTMLSNSNEAAVSATMNGRILMLERLTAEQAESEIAMRATSDGQYVDFNFRVIMNEVEGVEENHYGLIAYPNPTDGQLTLTIEGASGFDYHVFSLMGQSIMKGKVTGNETTFDLGHLNKGVYYISIEWNGNRLIKKVIVK